MTTRQTGRSIDCFWKDTEESRGQSVLVLAEVRAFLPHDPLRFCQSYFRVHRDHA